MGERLRRRRLRAHFEINETSSDVTADGRYRKITHETRSERRRSPGGDEMATHGGRARALRRRDPAHARASRASSPEINETSSDVTAGGRYRKITHETRSERRRSPGGDEMATHGGRARALRRRDPPLARASRASSSEINETSSDVTADGRYRKSIHETRSERRRSLRTDKMSTNGGRARTPSSRLIPKGPK